MPEARIRKTLKKYLKNVKWCKTGGKEEMEKCDYFMPLFDERITRGEILECLLRKYHAIKGHLVQHQDGTFRYWEHDTDCKDCDENDCECFVSRILTKEEAEKLIAEYGMKQRTA